MDIKASASAIDITLHNESLDPVRVRLAPGWKLAGATGVAGYTGTAGIGDQPGPDYLLTSPERYRFER
jgi:hypothetical protein